MPTPEIRRLHALDGLRAAMMLLGLVLHVAVSYVSIPLGAAWPYQDRSTSMAFDVLVFTIHLFRMPTFFVMAGFFAALLCHRSGPAGLLVHRVRRVLVPLVLFWLLVFPLTRFGFAFAQAEGGRPGLDAALTTLASPYEGTELIHLWFLYYLMIFYVVVVAVRPLWALLPSHVGATIDRGFGAVATRSWGMAVLAIVTMATLAPMEIPALETSTGFVPELRVLAAYFIFFGSGWLLFRRRDVIPSLAGKAWWYVVLGLALSVPYSQVVLATGLDPLYQHVLGIALASAATWLLVLGAIGVFVRCFEEPWRLQRYLSDGAYWIYLIHLPFAIFFTGLAAPAAWPAAVKFLLSLGGTTVVTLVTYHYAVRSTWVGVLLNGRRYARALPARVPDALPRSVPVPERPSLR